MQSWTNGKHTCILCTRYTFTLAYLPDPLSISEGLVPRLAVSWVETRVCVGGCGMCVSAVMWKLDIKGCKQCSRGWVTGMKCGQGWDLWSIPQDVLNWRTSRKFFYWRLRRQLCEQEALKVIMDADQWVGIKTFCLHDLEYSVTLLWRTQWGLRN